MIQILYFACLLLYFLPLIDVFEEELPTKLGYTQRRLRALMHFIKLMTFFHIFFDSLSIQTLVKGMVIFSFTKWLIDKKKKKKEKKHSPQNQFL